MASLSDQEIRHYRERGYVVPQFRLDDAWVSRLQDALNTLIRNNPGVRPEKLVSAHIEGQNDEGVRGSRDFFDLAMNPDIIDLVAQAIGPDVILWGCHVFCKPAGEGYETPWHQDGHYWPIRPLANCTVWVALEPSTRENGCLRVIPGSHTDKKLHPHLHEDRTDLTLKALRYMPGTSLFDRSLRPADGKTGVAVSFATRPPWLLRGEDKTGRNDFAVGHRDA
ncbi:MAG: phytanoyl-CoA dioxygenase family protein [Polaromonas sp.]|nr:phytanoyl-CoA dioxygenase family protein [Polaromonas sp.]